MNDIRIEVLSIDELYERTETEAENADLFIESTTASGDTKKRLHYLNVSDAQHQTHVVLYLCDRIVGIAGLQVNPYKEEQIWVQHVSVEDGYRGRGFASRLVEAVYKYASEHDKKVKPSSFTKLGQRLKKVFIRFDAQFPDLACGEAHEDF